MPRAPSFGGNFFTFPDRRARDSVHPGGGQHCLRLPKEGEEMVERPEPSSGRRRMPNQIISWKRPPEEEWQHLPQPQG